MRVAGDLIEFKEFNVVSSEDVDGYVKWIVGDAFRNLGTDTDTSFTFQGFRWRVNIYKQRYGFALALRKIPVNIPDIDGLDLPKSVVKLANLTQGLIMFCGPTGHGKSTSLAALIDRINQTRKCHILTIEDPIEYVHNDKVAIVHQREIGEDTPDFATALRSALREDIDVLLVGEMRDLETIQMAISAAETGHLVLGTIHSTDTIGVFRRIIDSFPPGQQDQIRTQLSATVKAVVAQFLLPSTSQGKRQLVCEVLTTNTAVKNIVRDNRLHELGSLLQTSAGEGMVSFDKSLARHVASGRIAPKIAEEWVRDKKTYMDYLSNLKLDHIAKDGDNSNDAVWG
jgi:twitching motility protein PilT